LGGARRGRSAVLRYARQGGAARPSDLLGVLRVAGGPRVARQGRPGVVGAAGRPLDAPRDHPSAAVGRIWNPIHTDVAVARSAGLAAPVLHGSATLALALSEVIREDLDGDPARVKEIAIRFTGLVYMPSTFTVRGRGRAGDLRGRRAR